MRISGVFLSGASVVLAGPPAKVGKTNESCWQKFDNAQTLYSREISDDGYVVAVVIPGVLIFGVLTWWCGCWRSDGDPWALHPPQSRRDVQAGIQLESRPPRNRPGTESVPSPTAGVIQHVEDAV